MEHVKYNIVRRVLDPTHYTCRSASTEVEEIDQSRPYVTHSGFSVAGKVRCRDFEHIRMDIISEFEKEMPELGQGSAHGKGREGRVGNEQSQFRTS